MRTFLGRIKTDPTTFVITHAAWSFICGLSLILPGAAWNYNKAWATLQAIHVDDSAWGVMMLIDAALLLVSIRWTDVAYRSAVSLVSSIMWMLLGISIVVTSWWQSQQLSVIGTFSVVISLVSLAAVSGWVKE